MTGVEIWRNGERLATAALEDGIVEVKLVIRNQVDPVVFDAVGRDAESGGHVKWAHIFAKIGDEFTLKVADMQPFTPAWIRLRHRRACLGGTLFIYQHQSREAQPPPAGLPRRSAV